MFNGISALGRKRARRPGNKEVCNFRRGALGRLGAKMVLSVPWRKGSVWSGGGGLLAGVRSSKGAREAGADGAQGEWSEGSQRPWRAVAGLGAVQGCSKPCKESLAWDFQTHQAVFGSAWGHFSCHSGWKGWEGILCRHLMSKGYG